jgi:hypothetical protein
MAGKKIIIITVLFLALAIPATLTLLKQQTGLNSRASAPDQLEAEGGTLSSTGAIKGLDTLASGGQYVKFGNQSTNPTPSVPPNSGTTATARITVGTKQQVGYDISFDGSTSTGYGPYGATDKFGIKTYYWNFGDGTPVQSSTYYGIHTHKYANSGNYTVTLTVEDFKGSVNSTTTSINAGTLPKVNVSGGDISSAIISLNGQPGIVSIPSGTYTISSNISLNSGVILQGAGKTSTKILTNGYTFTTAGENIRITGIEIAGPNTGYWLTHYDHKNLFVDNNDWHGYNYSTGLSNATAIFLNNSIHDNDVSGGDSYGIQSARDSYFLARENVFERNRHDVAAGGQNSPYVLFNNGYDLINNEFRYDPVNATIDAAIDMHPTGHGRIRIINNLIENVSYGIGLKDGWGEISGNTFKNIRSWAMKFGCNTHNGNVIDGAGVYNMNVYNNSYTNVGSKFVIVYGFNINIDGTTYNESVCLE